MAIAPCSSIDEHKGDQEGIDHGLRDVIRGCLCLGGFFFGATFAYGEEQLEYSQGLSSVVYEDKNTTFIIICTYLVECKS